mmetsp:Transcript_42107/g.88010  ORF Transcript_42107/g.88010 Transcript_42107/m.88010 type:complete len:282 (+) Transcript_42107:2479-3324(+)
MSPSMRARARGPRPRRSTADPAARSIRYCSSRRGGMIGVDWIAGLSTTAGGFDMIENHVDPLSGKVHAVPTRATATAADAAAIIRDMCFRSCDGFPDVLVVVGHVPKFTSAAFRACVMGMGSCLIIGSAYHKNTNAKAERANGVIRRHAGRLRQRAQGRLGPAAAPRRFRHQQRGLDPGRRPHALHRPWHTSSLAAVGPCRGRGRIASTLCPADARAGADGARTLGGCAAQGEARRGPGGHGVQGGDTPRSARGRSTPCSTLRRRSRPAVGISWPGAFLRD